MTDTVVLEVFPCEVLTPAGDVLRRAKAWVTEDGVVVAQEDEDRSVRVALSARHASPPALDDTLKVRRRQRHVVHTAGGDVVINPVLGCGCGTRLKTTSLADLRREVAV